MKWIRLPEDWSAGEVFCREVISRGFTGALVVLGVIKILVLEFYKIIGYSTS